MFWALTLFARLHVRSEVDGSPSWNRTKLTQINSLAARLVRYGE